jgi:hypothetical protein
MEPIYKPEIIHCERCNERLNPKTAVWLELSNSNGMYYTEIPAGHDSQGMFSFGRACAKKELAELINKDKIHNFNNL